MENDNAIKILKECIEKLGDAYDLKKEGFSETGNYGDTFQQGVDCGMIMAAIECLNNCLKYTIEK